MLPGDEFSRVFEQEQKDMKGLLFEVDADSMFAELRRIHVNLENAEAYAVVAKREGVHVRNPVEPNPNFGGERNTRRRSLSRSFLTNLPEKANG